MTRHARIPAFAALAIASAVGIGLLAGTGQFRAPDDSQASLDDLAKRIVDCKDGRVWLLYGNKLLEKGIHQQGGEALRTFSMAATAYKKAVDFAPDLDDARASIPFCWAMANDANAFFSSFSQLSLKYPKLAVDLLQRPGLENMRKDARWEPAAASARAQAVD